DVVVLIEAIAAENRLEQLARRLQDLGGSVLFNADGSANSAYLHGHAAPRCPDLSRWERIDRRIERFCPHMCRSLAITCTCDCTYVLRQEVPVECRDVSR